MSGAPNRLPPPGDRGFAQRDIDRSRALSFRLNGLVVHGFAGDTILSAALASGIVAAGRWHGAPIALDEQFAPAVLPVHAASDPAAALPMERTPAIDGADFVTLGREPQARRSSGAADRLVRLFARRPQSLGLALDEPIERRIPVAETAPHEEASADLIVVGAGVAGLSAAIAAAEAGDSVIVVERRPFAGGDAPYFGVVDDEEPPLDAMTRLLSQGVALANVRLLTRTLALSVRTGEVRAHRVGMRDGHPACRYLVLRAPRIVLATGTAERLPLVPGNRTPSVVGSIAAWHRADRYGVWIAGSSAVATTQSQAYRTAIRAADSGARVVNVVDTRPAPVSRFIDFCKASGIQPRFGEALAAIAPPERRRETLLVRYAPTVRGGEAPPPATLDQLVVAGGWQPAIELWLSAGGDCAWSAADGTIVPAGSVPGIVLAGAVAGWQSTSACARSGEAAAAALFGRPLPDIEERRVDPAFETPDALPERPASVAADLPPAFLDAGHSLLTLPPPPPVRRLLPAWRPSAPGPDRAVALSPGDVAGAVQAGLVPPETAPAVAAARVLRSVRLGDVAPRAGALPSLHEGAALPDWLAGRFGEQPQFWRIERPGHPRSFEPGSLVFADFEAADPLAALGVVLAAAPDETRSAVIVAAAGRFVIGSRVIVNDAAGAVEAVVTAEAAPSSAAPGGGGSGPS